jgi:tripartite-type tricarboxylate transporter receptor subunit TctC
MEKFGSMTRVLNTVVAFVLTALSIGVQAQNYPSRPVRMVIHIGPGSSMDIVGRVLAQKLDETWGQPVIVDNRAGAGGTIGMDTVAKAAPDGYTILFGSSSVSIAAPYHKKLPFDALRDLALITQLSSRHNALVVSPNSPVTSVKDLIALAKSKPGQLSYGSGGGSEAGLPGFEVNVWYGLFVPRGTPAKIVDKIAADVNQLLKTPEMRKRFTALGAEGTTPAQFQAYFRSDMDKWRKVVKASGVSGD